MLLKKLATAKSKIESLFKSLEINDIGKVPTLVLILPWKDNAEQVPLLELLLVLDELLTPLEELLLLEPEVLPLLVLDELLLLEPDEVLLLVLDELTPLELDDDEPPPELDVVDEVQLGTLQTKVSKLRQHGAPILHTKNSLFVQSGTNPDVQYVPLVHTGVPLLDDELTPLELDEDELPPVDELLLVLDVDELLELDDELVTPLELPPELDEVLELDDDVLPDELLLLDVDDVLPLLELDDELPPLDELLLLELELDEPLELPPPELDELDVDDVLLTPGIHTAIL